MQWSCVKSSTAAIVATAVIATAADTGFLYPNPKPKVDRLTCNVTVSSSEACIGAPGSSGILSGVTVKPDFSMGLVSMAKATLMQPVLTALNLRT